MPPVVLARERATRDHVMERGVRVSLPAPGVQDTEEAWHVAADESGIGGQCLDRLR